MTMIYIGYWEPLKDRMAPDEQQPTPILILSQIIWKRSCVSYRHIYMSGFWVPLGVFGEENGKDVVQDMDTDTVRLNCKTILILWHMDVYIGRKASDKME
eukprot:762173_1